MLAIASLLVLGGGQAWGAWSAAGVVKSTAGTVLPAVEVTVKDSSSYKTTTNDKGEFKLESSASVGSFIRSSKFSIQRSGDVLMIGYPGEGILEVSLLDASGTLLWNEHAALVQGAARAQVPARGRDLGAILMVRLGSEVHSQVVPLGNAKGWNSIPAMAARSMAAPYPTLVFKKAGYADTTLALTKDISNGLTVAMRDTTTKKTDFVEDHRSACKIPAIPTGSNAKLPNPFKMIDGTPVTTKDQWTCRREEIAAMFEATELGEKPRNPESVTGEFSNGTLKVTVKDKGKTISFTVAISGAGNPSKPVPAVIGFGGGSLGSSFSGMGVATINFNQDLVAPEKPRGSGPFYTLYGSNHSAGAMIAWAWGISRIIDALAVTPAAGIKVDKLAINGCSRHGKGALVAGTFDQRIALVIPQESGSGGASNWRSVAADSKAQPLSHACQEAAWFKGSFCDYGSKTNNLPTDHHMLTGMVAPRGLLVLDNVGWDWLGEVPSYHNAMSTKEIFVALGATESFSYSQIGDHQHCTLPETQFHWVKSYVNKFMLDKTGETAKIETKANVSYDKAKWIDWTTPTLN